MSSAQQNNELTVGIGMLAVEGLSKPTRNFGRRRVTGSDSPADSENQIARQLQISRRSMPCVATWMWSEDSHRQLLQVIAIT